MSAGERGPWEYLQLLLNKLAAIKVDLIILSWKFCRWFPNNFFCRYIESFKLNLTIMFVLLKPIVVCKARLMCPH